MTLLDFKSLPALVRLDTVRRVTGFPDETIEALRFAVARLDDPVPARRIGCLYLPGRSATRKSNRGRRWYRTGDLVPFLRVTSDK